MSWGLLWTCQEIDQKSRLPLNIRIIYIYIYYYIICIDIYIYVEKHILRKVLLVAPQKSVRKKPSILAIHFDQQKMEAMN